jgi:hypothetical protein
MPKTCDTLCRCRETPHADVLIQDTAGGTHKTALTLGVRIKLAPARDPEFKGLVERRNGFFETSFLPGRTFTSPFDFNTQLTDWLARRANTRLLPSIGGRPVDRWATDRTAMVPLPPVAPAVGLTNRVRLARDYFVRIDSNDYSVDPRAIGRFVDVLATPARVVATCAGQVVADHARPWATAATITDPAHRETARILRADLATRRRTQATRSHPDGQVVAIRALPDYDALFGVDFDPTPHESTRSPGSADDHHHD